MKLCDMQITAHNSTCPDEEEEEEEENGSSSKIRRERFYICTNVGLSVVSERRCRVYLYTTPTKERRRRRRSLFLLIYNSVT